MADQTIRDVVIKLAIDVSNARKQIDELTTASKEFEKAMQKAVTASESANSSRTVGGVHSPRAGSSRAASSAPAQRTADDQLQAYRTEMFNRNALLREKDALDAQKAEDKRVAAEQKADAAIIAHRQELYNKNAALRERDRQESERVQQAMRQEVSDNDVRNKVSTTQKNKQDELQNQKDSAAARQQSAIDTRGNLHAAGSIATDVLTAIKHEMEQLGRLNSSIMQQNIGAMTNSSRVVVGQGMLEAESHMAASSMIFDSASASRYRRNIPFNERLETERHATFQRTDITMGQKESLINRRESEAASVMKQKAIDEDIAHLKAQKAEAAQSQKKNEQMPGTIVRQHAKNRERIMEQAINIDQNSASMFAGLGFHTQNEQRDQERFAEQMQQDQVQENNEIRAAQEGVNTAVERQKQLEGEINQKLQEKHSLIKQTQKEADSAYYNAKEGYAKSQESFGMMDAKEQALVGIAHKKALAGQKLLPHELRILHSHGMDMETVRDQAMANARAMGFEATEHTSKDVEEKRDHAAQMRRDKKPELDATEVAMGEAEEETGRLAQKSVDAMKGVFETRKYVQELERRLKDLEAENTTSEVKRGMLTTGFSAAQ